MDKLLALLADAQQYLAAASPREKRLLLLASAGAAVLLLLAVTASFAGAIRRHGLSLEEKRGDFVKAQRLSAGYSAQEQERQLLEARLRQSPPALMGFVDGLARQEGVDVGAMFDRGVVSGGQGGRPRESQVEVSLGKVPLDKLMRLLESIERSPGVVRVRRLRLRRSPDNKDALDVNLTVSAWQGA